MPIRPDVDMPFVQSGVLSLNDTGEQLKPGLSTDRLSSMRIRAGGELHLRPDGAVFTARGRIEGRRMFFAAAFPAGVLGTLELVLLDGAGADGMSQQPELKQEHERWLAGLGVPLNPVPLILDGQTIYPDHPGPEHPRRATLKWGSVTSLIDPRNGGASIIVRYDRLRYEALAQS